MTSLACAPFAALVAFWLVAFVTGVVYIILAMMASLPCLRVVLS